MVALSVNFVGNDTCVWSLNTKGIFSVRSMYLFFMDGGCINYSMNYLWELKLSLNVHCFFGWLSKIRFLLLIICAERVGLILYHVFFALIMSQ
jgi:hypothetical protein